MMTALILTPPIPKETSQGYFKPMKFKAKLECCSDAAIPPDQMKKVMNTR
jgi:hypothetical protein